jgi:CheY-like chemotaxis protein
MSARVVLLVDDHEDTCQGLVRLLRRDGLEAEFVTTGYDALAYMERTVPRVVILDVMMPDMSGIEVLRNIRANAAWASIPVLMYSADAGHGSLTEALRAGAQGYLVKGTIGWRQFVEEVRRYA